MSRWKLSEVIRIRWDDVRGAILGGICALTRVMRELMSPLCSPPGENITRIWQSITQKRALTRTSHDGTLVRNLQNLCKKNGYNPFSLWYFVRAAEMKKEPTAGIPETACHTHLLQRTSVTFWSPIQLSFLSPHSAAQFFPLSFKTMILLCETCLLSVATLSWSSCLHVVVTSSSSVLYAFLQARNLKGLTSVPPLCSPRTIFLCHGLGCVLQKDAEILTLGVCECDLIWK